MNVAIPPEFEAFARDLVAAGHVASVDEAVAAALKDQLDRIEELRSLLDPALAEIDRGDTVDGRAFMRDLIDDFRARARG